MVLVLIHREVIRKNLSIEESEHYIKSFPYCRRKFMYTDPQTFDTIEETYL